MYKNQLKIDQRPKVKTWDFEVVEQNIGETIQDVGVGDDFLDKIPKAQAKVCKARKMILNQTQKLLYNKVNNTNFPIFPLCVIPLNVFEIKW